MIFVLFFLSLMVLASRSQAALLAWNAPTTSEDGTPLTDLNCYTVYYWQASWALPANVPCQQIGKQTTYDLAKLGLEAGKSYSFAVSASDTSGNESALSNQKGQVNYTAPVSAPNANFTASITSGTAPLNVDFTDKSTGTITKWLWDFGDGGSSTMQNPSYRYQAEGAYTVTLTAYGPGGSDTEKRVAFITVVPEGTSRQVSLAPQQDTFLNLDDVNYSTDSMLNTYTWPAQRVANAILMHFNLANIPAGATIHKASLDLYLVEADQQPEATYTITVHRIIRKKPNLNQATGFTYDGSNDWTSSACCYNGVPLAQADIAPAVGTQQVNKTAGYKSWDVTALVQAWVNAPATNLGLLLNSDATKGADRYRSFASMENPDANKRPVLRVTYSISDPTPAQEATFASIAVEDGWVYESRAGSGVGGGISATGTGSSALRAGDDIQNRQYKFILSFDTSALPDSATVQGATLFLTRGGTSGQNPFNTHGPLYVDIMNGTFGKAALEKGDFEAKAHAEQVATIDNQGGSGTLYKIDLSNAVNHINKTGRTQLRVYFDVDNNGDGGYDYAGFYSSDNSNSARHPLLVITYQE
jgi:PKD repeat protein